MLLDGAFARDYRVRKEAFSLVAAGHEVRVLEPGAVASVTRDEGVEVQSFVAPTGAVARLWNLAHALGRTHWPWLRATRDAARDFAPEVLHVHDLPLVATAARVARERGAKLIADMHENMPALMQLIVPIDRWPWSSLHRLERWQAHERDALSAADAVLCVVEEARDRLRDEALVPAERLFVVSNYDHAPGASAVEPDAPGESAPAATAALRLGYFGVMNGHRGLRFALEGLAESPPDTRLILAGDGPERAELEQRAAELGLVERVEFRGWQRLEDMPAALAEPDVGLVLHDRNALTESTIPNKLFGYMAAGVPVLVTDLGPLRRIVEESDSGRVVPTGDRAALLATLAELGDPVLRRRLGTNGRAAVRECYNWSAAERRLLEAYASVV